MERGLEYHFGGQAAYQDWQKQVWNTAWPPTFWVANAVARLVQVLEDSHLMEGWQDGRYLVMDDFEVTTLVSHQPALALLQVLKEINCLDWDEMVSLEKSSDK